MPRPTFRSAQNGHWQSIILVAIGITSILGTFTRYLLPLLLHDFGMNRAAEWLDYNPLLFYVLFFACVLLFFCHRLYAIALDSWEADMKLRLKETQPSEQHLWEDASW